MLRTRVIPALLLRNRGLVKTIKFKDPKYLGDPINIVKIFNDKEVDELVFLDITATKERKGPPFDLLANITSECFMPLGYGGGIRKMDEVKRLLSMGIEKIILNSYAVENPDFVSEVAAFAGNQAVVISIDVKKNWRSKYEVFTHGGTKKTDLNPVDFALQMQEKGAGEIFLNSIDRDGTMEGYDLELTKSVAEVLEVPLIACGGAKNVQDLGDVVKQGSASAAAAGSIFVFQGPLRGVLISYPSQKELQAVLP